VIKENTVKGIAVVAALFILAAVPVSRGAQAQQAQQSQQPQYTMPEYNGFRNCQDEKDPQIAVKCLDGFVAQFPNSTLLMYVYQLYYQDYYQLKNYAKTLEYADKLAALEKADLGMRVTAVQARIQVFPATPDPKDWAKERDAAQLGIKLVQQYKSLPDSKVTDEQYKKSMAPFYAAAGLASYQLKDYAAAVEFFKSALANNPTDAASQYRMGLAYLAMNPPQALDGFWAVARSIQLKIPDSPKVKDYLRAQVLRYEQPQCETVVDAQVNELLQLSAGATERPASFSIPSAADLQKIAQASTIVTMLSDLQAGGDKAKMTWLALCGAEFPEVVGKIIDVSSADNAVVFHVFTDADENKMQDATSANMEVKVPGQPEAARLAKDDPIRFSGTVASYDAQPFMLHWDSGKVDASIIPAEKGAKRPARKPAARNPGQ
jgi:tetratricopeptide (TPR) repeat protein